VDTVGIYLAIDRDHKRALEISDIMGHRIDEELIWLAGKDKRKNMNRIRMDLACLQKMTRILRNAGHPDRASRYEMYFKKNYAAFRAG
jgi:hypothetical protein